MYQLRETRENPMNDKATFKVVQRHGDVFCSTMTSGDALVEYRPGHAAKAPGWLLEEGLGLCCFSTFPAAARFASRFAPISVKIALCVGFGRIETLATPCNIVALEGGVIDKIENGWWEPDTEMFEKVRIETFI
jgi:hypothetical protein